MAFVDLNGNGIDDSQETTAGQVNKIFIPGFTDDPKVGRGVAVAEGKNFFKNLKETNPAAYNLILQKIAAIGIQPTRKNYNTIMANAVDWTQSIMNPLRSSPQGINPIDYLNYVDPTIVETSDKKKYGTTKQETVTQTEYSASAAEQDIQQMARQELGREATAKEVKSYTDLVNKEAAKQPSIYSGSTTTSPGASRTVGKQTTGFDPTEFARKYARSMPDYAESFAAKDFLTTLDSLIQSPARVGKVVSE